MSIAPMDGCGSASIPVPNLPEGNNAYIIYCIRHRLSFRPYVGMTKRPLKIRVAAHVIQARRKRRVRANGLLQAIRDTHADGMSFAEAFTATVLDTAPDVERARDLERSWIDRLRARQPSGYNAMPGGASVGGPANARSITVDLPDGGRLSWTSIGSAIVACNQALKVSGLRPLLAATAYMRLQSGWPPDEALGLSPREDRRSLRPKPVTVDGNTCHSLTRASAALGLTTGALRSRLHRAGGGPTTDIAVDRRRVPRGRSPAIAIVWPATGEKLTAREFAARTGVPKATILRRWHQAARRADVATDPSALASWLQTSQDRRKILRLVLPDGTAWEGGYRELTRHLLAHPQWEAQRTRRLGESGIKRRLRRQSEADQADPRQVRWAFGFDGG